MIKTLSYETEELRGQAQLYAEQLNLQLDNKTIPCLYLDADHLSLKMQNFSSMHADFSAKSWQKRKDEGKKQGLIRACKPTSGLKIIDTTAGWGRDAAILASFGAEVLMIERHPLMAALLQDALSRQSEKDKQQLKISLHSGDAISYLNALTPVEYPDIIYIDPMHPERGKSALVKKEMQALQQLIGVDTDASSLIQIAIQRVKQRVVVKWPQKTEALFATNSSIEGKTVRFDLYVPA